jgi:hypothetical protein
MLRQFLNGAITFGFLVAAVFFLRFWRRSAERLFAMFAAAFFVLAIERVILALVSPENEFRSFVYIVRLVAFVLIIIAIVDKNRGAKPRRASLPEHKNDQVR